MFEVHGRHFISHVKGGTVLSDLIYDCYCTRMVVRASHKLTNVVLLVDFITAEILRGARTELFT